MDQDKSYGGDRSARQAWETLSSESEARLIDCRTSPEWGFVGVPDLRSLKKTTLFIPWQVYPAMQLNDQFADQLREAGIGRNHPLFFICRSGARSQVAAMAMSAQGFGQCFNVAHGFEGNHDDQGHRSKINGWKAEGLPWTQE